MHTTLPLDTWRAVNALPTREIAATLGLAPTRERNKWFCPVHGGGSLHAYEDHWYCYNPACGCRYSNIDLAAVVLHLEPKAACLELAQAYGLVPQGSASVAPTGTPKPRVVKGGRNGVSERESAASAALDEMRNGGCSVATPADVYAVLSGELELTERGAEYLAQRGIDPHGASEYGFRSIDGPDDWCRLREILLDSYTPAELAQAGFAVQDMGTRGLPWGGRSSALLIPYNDGRRLVGIRFRRLDPLNHHRYHTLAGASLSVPFNADALRGASGETLHVVEGELNAYTLQMYGLRAFGLAGAGIWRGGWTPGLRDVRHLTVWYDADPAGDRGAASLASTLQAAFGTSWLTAKALLVRTLRDPNDLHIRGELNAVIESIAER